MTKKYECDFYGYYIERSQEYLHKDGNCDFSCVTLETVYLKIDNDIIQIKQDWDHSKSYKITTIQTISKPRHKTKRKKKQQDRIIRNLSLVKTPYKCYCIKGEYDRIIKWDRYNLKDGYTLVSKNDNIICQFGWNGNNNNQYQSYINKEFMEKCELFAVINNL